MRPHRSNKFAIVVFILALIASACVDESDEPDGAGDVSSSSEPSEEPTATPGQTDENEDTNDGNDDGGSDAPLTASDTGVSETTITIGIPAIDLDALRDLGIIADTPELDEIGAWESAIAIVNERGGIYGRMIEPVYATYLPLGQAQADAACIELIEDNEIFVAIGSLIVPEGVLCYTELNGTPFLGGTGALTQEIEARSLELALSIDAMTLTTHFAVIDFAEAQGEFERPIAVHGDNRTTIEAVVAELENRGATVVSMSVSSAPETDSAARVGEFEQIFERWRSDGAEVVINTGTSLDMLSAMGRQEFYIDAYAADASARQYAATTSGEEREFEALRHYTMVNGAPPVAYDDFSHEPTNVCREGWDRHNPDLPIADTVDQHGTVEGTCAVIELFAALAQEAGPNLTHEGFAAAAEALEVVDLAGARDVRIGGDGVSGPTSIAVWRWSEETGEMEEVDAVQLGG